MKAPIGTPAGFSQSGSILGHCEAGAVKRALGCAAGFPDAGSHFCPLQSVRSFGASLVIPSHQISLSAVIATFVKMVFFSIVFIAFGFVFVFVPGATPKYPASGFIA